MPEQTSFPLTEPHVAPIFDTGPHPDPLRSLGGVDPEPELPGITDVEDFETDAIMRPLGELLRAEPYAGSDAVPLSEPHAEPVVVPAQPVAGFPGSHQYLKRWHLLLGLAGVWLAAGVAGIGLYHWWYTSLSKTAPVFVVLVYLMVCTIASVLISMVPNRPRVTVTAIALMAAPLASVAAAAVVHGAYYFEWIARPALG